MKSKVFLISMVTYIIVFLSGCTKNHEPKPNLALEPFDSNVNVGVISFVGNSFEYYLDKQYFNNRFRYTEINDWNIDEYIVKILESKMTSKGFKNIKKLSPSKTFIIDKNKFYYPDERKSYLVNYFMKIMNKNSMDVIIYVENLPYYRLGTGRVGLKHADSSVSPLINYNFSIHDIDGVVRNKVILNNNFIMYILFKKDIEDKNKVGFAYSYGSMSREIDRAEFIDKHKLYEKVNLTKLEPIFKDMVMKNIDDIFEKRAIMIKKLN